MLHSPLFVAINLAAFPWKLHVPLNTLGEIDSKPTESYD